MDFLSGAYLWIKAFHILSVIAWMAALLYLPRLFVYYDPCNDRSVVVWDLPDGYARYRRLEQCLVLCETGIDHCDDNCPYVVRLLHKSIR